MEGLSVKKGWLFPKDLIEQSCKAHSPFYQLRVDRGDVIIIISIAQPGVVFPDLIVKLLGDGIRFIQPFAQGIGLELFPL